MWQKGRAYFDCTTTKVDPLGSTLYMSYSSACGSDPKGSWTSSNQFKPAQQSRQKALRAYCPNIYTMPCVFSPVCDNNITFKE